MKEVLISIIGTIGLGGLITFLIKRYDEKQDKNKKNIIEVLKTVCAYNQVIIDYMSQHISLLKQKSHKLEEPVLSLSEKMDQQKRNFRKLKKIKKDCATKNIRNCDECCKLQEIYNIRDDEINKTFTQIKTIKKEDEKELIQKIIDTRENIRNFNGLLNRPAVNSIKFSKLYSLLSELDVRTIKILTHEPNEDAEKFNNLLIEQHTTINHIKSLINKRLS